MHRIAQVFCAPAQNIIGGESDWLIVMISEPVRLLRISFNVVWRWARFNFPGITAIMPQ